MFESQIRITGRHAQYLVELTSIFDEKSNAKVFETYMDVYVTAAIVGILHHRRADKDNSGDFEMHKNIFAEQVLRIKDELDFIMQIMLLIDKEYEPDEEKRIDKAFRFFGQDVNDLKRFETYIYGGIDILHERLVEGGGDVMEYIIRMQEFVEDIDAQFNEGITPDDIMTLATVSKK